MSSDGLGAIIGIIVTVFVVILLGYVCTLVLLQLSLLAAVLFVLFIAILLFAIIIGIFRRSGD